MASLWRSTQHGCEKCTRGLYRILLVRRYGSSSADDRAELCRKLVESRDREINALKMALEARKAEANAVAMLNRRVKIDVNGMKDDDSLGNSKELEALRRALCAQERENFRLVQVNKKLKMELEEWKNGKQFGEPEKTQVLSEWADRNFIKLVKPEGGDGRNKHVDVPTSSSPELATAERKDAAEFHANTGSSVTIPDVPGKHEAVEVPAEDHHQSVRPAHPWLEWTKFVEHLRRREHLKTASDETNDENIKAAAMSFCATHENILERISQEDLLVFASFGCPNTDRRNVNSGKRLRKHLNLAEADVCKFCNLSNTCSRAYAESTATVAGVENSDVVWLLVQFGFDTVNKPAERRPLPQHIETSIRNLLRQFVFLADNPQAVVEEKAELQPGDWRCTKCKLLNFSGSKLCRGCSNPCGHDTLKNGEWKCIKCSTKNGPRNLLCQECDVPRPPKELRWGDWECSQCLAVNYARNKECFRCKSKQPPFKERQMIGVNRNVIVDRSPKPPPVFTSLGVTPWLMTKEEKEAESLKMTHLS